MIYETALDFPDKGLVLVLGTNTQDSHGKLQSVGSGKTLIGEAISRALLGVPGRFTRLGDFSCDHRDNRNTYVKLLADLDGHPLEVELGYKCRELSRTGEGLRFKIGDRSICRARIEDTREELLDLTRVTPDLAEWTVFIDGDKLSFNKLSEKRAVELLMAALTQPPWTEYHQRALRVFANFKQEASVAEAAYGEAKLSVSRAKELVDSAEVVVKDETGRLAEIQARHRRAIDDQGEVVQAASSNVEKIQGRKSEIKRELARIEQENANEFAKLDEQLNHARTKLARARHLKDIKLKPKFSAESDETAARDRLKELYGAPKNCPRCGQKLDKQPTRDEIETAEIQARDAIAKCLKFRNSLSRLQTDIQNYSDEVYRLEADIKRQKVKPEVQRLGREFEDLETRLEGAVRAYDDAQRKLSRLNQPVDQSALVSAKAVLADRNERFAAAKSRVEETALAKTDAEAAVSVVKYWVEAFSPTGIPNIILRETIGPLNDVSRRLSLILTGNTIVVSYDTTKTLASGTDRAELVIRVDNKIGSKRPEGGSKGESGLTNLIIAETLAEVGQVAGRVGFRWYDEVVKSQDPVVRRSIFSYLRDTANRLGIPIFVVDHSPEAANYVDHVLMVEKTALAGTVARWA